MNYIILLSIFDFIKVKVKGVRVYIVCRWKVKKTKVVEESNAQ